MTVIRDPRMQARAEYVEARKEAHRKHLELCKELGLTDPDYIEETFEAWLQGWEFDVASDGKGGSYLCMTRGRIPEGGWRNEGLTEIPFEETPDGQRTT